MKPEVKAFVESRIKASRDNLARDCRALARTLTLLAANCANPDVSDVELNINPLGEIQAQGNMIDAKCGLLSGQITTWEAVKES